MLASASPRRRALIALLGLAHRATALDLDESRHEVGDPALDALSVAAAKARAAVTVATPGELILGADTTVVLDDRLLGKPADPGEAHAMLRALRGRWHQVRSGVLLRAPDGREWGAVVSTAVHMRDYSDEEVAAYTARREPFDKAGGYAVQDRDFRPVDRLEGCYLNVVGLPLCAVARGLEALGVAAPGTPMEPLVPRCALCRAGEPLVEIA